MKRSFKFCLGGFAVAMLFLCVGFCFSACGHTHTFGDWVVETESTCSVHGVEKRYCTDCDEVEVRELPLLEHSFGEWQVVEAVKCLEDGLNTRECENCGFVEEQVVVHQGHDYDAWTSDGNFNEQTNNGTHSRRCKNCDDVEKEACTYILTDIKATCTSAGKHIHTCDGCNNVYEHETDPQLTHNFGSGAEIVYVGTREDGTHYHKKLCSHGCGAEQEEDCTEEVINHFDATCFEIGYDVKKCSTCNNTYEKQTADKLEHELTQKQPSADGLHHEQTCNKCQTVFTELCDLEHENHEVTCEQDGYVLTTCATCGRQDRHENTPALGHSYNGYIQEGNSMETSVHYQKCTRCQQETERESCKNFKTEERSPETCDKSEEIVEHCSVCLIQFTTQGAEATGHEYDDNDWTYDDGNFGHHYHECKKCGKRETKECEWDYKTDLPDCTHPGKTTQTCLYCEHEHVVSIEPIGHLWVEEGVEEDRNEWTITDETHKRTCKRPNCGVSEENAHTFNHTNLCDSCGYDGLTYELEGDNAFVRNDDRVLTATEIIVAATYKEKPVTRICSAMDTKDNKFSGFYFNKTIRKITLPSSIVQIGDYSFVNCNNLVEVVFDGESSLTTIGENAFQSCEALTTITFPNKLMIIGPSAFWGCRRLANISLPTTVTDIGDNAFSSTAFMNNTQNWEGKVLYLNKHLIRAIPNLEGSYDIDDGTLTISACAFKDCTNLTEIILPASIKEISTDAFKNCTGLQKVIFKGSLSDWLSIKFANDAASPMSVCGRLEIQGAKEDIKIPAGATSIPAGAFKGSNITSIEIPASVTSIGEEAFENCSQLTTVTVLGKLTYVGENAFTGTPFYENHFVNGLLYVGNCLVAANDKVSQDVVIQAGTVSIAVGAFMGNTQIKSVVLPASLKYIGQHAFKNSSLELARFENGKSWWAFMEEGAGRMPDENILTSTNNTDKTTDNQKMTAYYLKNIYSNFWTKKS